MFEVGEKEGVILPTSCWEALENACLMHRPDVVMVDPLVAINAVPENDNQLIRRVMTVLKIGLTQRFNCALVIAHHDLKAGGSNGDFPTRPTPVVPATSSTPSALNSPSKRCRCSRLAR